VNIEGSVLTRAIKGHCRVITPDFHSDQALMCLTSLGSVSNCLSSACWVTVQAGRAQQVDPRERTRGAEAAGLPGEITDHRIDG